MPLLPERYGPPQGYDPEEDPAPSFPGMSLHDFMRQTSQYEQRPAPFSPLLRRAARTGMLLTLLTFSIVLLLPALTDGMKALYFPLWLTALNTYLVAYLRWLASSVWVRYLDGALLGSGIVLLILTRNLRRGRLEQQWLAFVQALGGCANLVLLIIPLLLFLPNLILWIVVFIILIFLLVLLFRVFQSLL
jgi:hypothetical protein